MKLFFDIVKNSVLILIRENDVRFEVDFKAKKILFNASVLESKFYNMISNSIKYGPKNKQIVIKISSYNKDGMTKLIFEDNGIGLFMIKQMNEPNGGSLNV